jgi:hypothetical protein
MGFNINDYEPVEDRQARFWEDHPGGRIETILLKAQDGEFIVRTEIYRSITDEVPSATGLAQEVVDTANRKSVNFASSLENCETSSIGRGLANLGYAPKTKRPSREEMMKVDRMTRSTTQPGSVRLNLEDLKIRLMAFSKNQDERKGYVLSTLGMDTLTSLNDLDDSQIEKVVTALTAGTAPFTEEESS